MEARILASLMLIASSILNAAIASPISSGNGTLTTSSVAAASTNATVTSDLGGSQCTWPASAIIPTDVPTQSPYVSADGTEYFPVGSQNGWILTGARYAGRVMSSENWPISNSYTRALTECSNFCNNMPSQNLGACLSFNIFTVYEDDWNNCTPSYECRFSSLTWNDTVANSSNLVYNQWPSYGWTVKKAATPQCDPKANYAPSLWRSAGMDDWLMSVAKENGLLGQHKFTTNLFNEIGWSKYWCDSPKAAEAGQCISPSSDPDFPGCAVWANVQTDLYFESLNVLAKAYDTFQSKINNQGLQPYLDFWNTEAVPSAATMNLRPIVEDLVNGVIGSVPDVGNLLEAGAEVFEYVIDSVPATETVTGPTASGSWSKFINIMSEALNTLSEGLYSQGETVGDTDALLNMMKDGAFFLDDADSIEVDPYKTWDNYHPFYARTAALDSMKQQGVFLLRAPISGASSGPCTQSIADQITTYIEQGSDGSAWCDTDGNHVIIPIAGWNPRDPQVFRVMGHVSNISSTLSLTDITKSAFDCTPDFNSGKSSSIVPYKAYNTTGWNFQAAEYDLTKPCVWSMPVCDYDSWHYSAYVESEKHGFQYNGQVGESMPLQFSDFLVDVAGWCAYEFGFTSESQWCVERIDHLDNRDLPVTIRTCFPFSDFDKIWTLT